MVFEKPLVDPAPEPYPHTLRIKDEPAQTFTIGFVRHRVDPCTEYVTYAWGPGDVRVSVSAQMQGEALVRAFTHVLRATSHWTRANRIEIQISECTYNQCLCLTIGTASPGGV